MEYLVIFLLFITFFGIVGMILACVPFKRIYASLLRVSQRKNTRIFSSSKMPRQEPNLRNAELFNLNLSPVPKTQFSPEKNFSNAKDEFTILYLLAPTNAYYKGTVVWHTLIEQNLVYGEMRIFHAYDSNTKVNRKILFSVAGATEPGYLNQENIEGKNISGLCFFMLNDDASRVLENFQKMLRTAYQIHSILGGKLCNALQTPLTKAMIEQYQKHLSSAMLI